MNLEIQQFLYSVTFRAVDLMGLIQYRPALIQKVSMEVVNLLQGSTVEAVSPIHEFVVSEAETTSGSLQSDKSMGKLVIMPLESNLLQHVNVIVPPHHPEATCVS